MDAFIEDLESIGIADQIFKDVNQSLQDYGVDTKTVTAMLDGISSEFAKGLGKQAENIASSLKNQGKAKDEINSAMNNIFGDLQSVLNDSNIPEALREDLEAQFAGLDLTNAEELKKFQIDLIETYGISADKAKELTEGIAGATLAVSTLTTTVEVFGDLY
jgi:hypothetical protein